MIFTPEQFRYLESDEEFCLDELPLDDDDKGTMFRLLNALPRLIQGSILSFGFSDTEVREKIFVFLCKNQFGVTTKQFYEQDIWKQPVQKIDFTKLEEKV